MTLEQKLQVFKEILYAKDPILAVYLSNNSFLTYYILETLNSQQDIIKYFDNLEIPEIFISRSLLEQKLYVVSKYISYKQYRHIFSSESDFLENLNRVDSLKEILQLIDKLPKI